jgi:hypothetical protein
LVFVGQPSFGVATYATGRDANGASTDYWRLDLATGATEELGPTLPDPPPPDLGGAGFTCTETTDGGVSTLMLIDPQTGVQTDIDGVVASFPPCPSPMDPTMAVWRDDGAGHLVAFYGPYDQLQPIAINLQVTALVSWGLQTSTVIGADPAQPTALGIYDVALPSGAVTPRVPPALGSAAWAPNTPPGGPLMSASLSESGHPFADGVTLLKDHFIYARAMSDGGTTMFAGPFGATATANELALFRFDAATLRWIELGSSQPSGLNYYAALFRRRAWRRPGNGGDLLLEWDDAVGRLASCPLAPSMPPQTVGIVPSRPDATSDGVLFGVDNSYQESYAGQAGQSVGGPLLLVRPSLDGAAACSELVPADVIVEGFSPAGGEMFWVSAPAGGDRTLSVATGDGSGARQIGSGPIRLPAFTSETELDLILGSDLAWLDIRDQPVRMHYIAERVFGQRIDLPPAWSVTGHDFDQQQGTGDLGVVNRPTGAMKPISPAVVWYSNVTLSPPDGGAVSGALPLAILYLVRGRNPSAQDGLWLATITADDLQ